MLTRKVKKKKELSVFDHFVGLALKELTFMIFAALVSFNFNTLPTLPVHNFLLERYKLDLIN